MNTHTDKADFLDVFAVPFYAALSFAQLASFSLPSVFGKHKASGAVWTCYTTSPKKPFRIFDTLRYFVVKCPRAVEQAHLRNGDFMAGVPLILIFVLTAAGMILALSKLQIHPFLTILGMSLALAFAASVPIGSIPSVINTGFSSIFTGTGLVVIFGLLIGGMLEATGAVMKITSMIIKLVGKKSPTLAFMIMGWVVSMSISCESGFVALNPVRKSAVKHAGTSSVATAVGLGSGLYISHALFPFAPGPLAVSAMLGLADSLPLVLAMALAVSLPALFGAYRYAVYIGRNKKTEEDAIAVDKETVTYYRKLLRKHGKLPNGFLCIAPILAPISLMALGAVASLFGLNGPARYVVAFLGEPIIAMIIGVLFAALLLAITRRMKDFNPVTESALKAAGPILCVVGAGGVFGGVIAESGMIELITPSASTLQSLGLFFPFLIAAAIKIAQGSSTIAMISAAGIVAPLASAIGLDSPAMSALAVMATGAGSMVASHANDPYFWIVTKLSGMSPSQGFASHTVITLVAGLCCMAGVFALSLVFG